jgi:hypothetical protein
LQTTFTSLPSQAQPALYASQTAPGAGKHEPVAEHPSAVGNPQIMPVPHCASVAHDPVPPLELAPLLEAPLEPPTPPSMPPEGVVVEPAQPPRTAAKTPAPIHRTVLTH